MSIFTKRKYNLPEGFTFLYKSNFSERIDEKIDEKEFWSLVDVKSVNECWLWKGIYFAGGYGKFHDGAHRVSYKIKNGKIPKGKEICHKCNNQSCVNPSHLYAGTHKDNMNDTRITNNLNDGTLKGKTNKLILFWKNK